MVTPLGASGVPPSAASPLAKPFPRGTTPPRQWHHTPLDAGMRLPAVTDGCTVGVVARFPVMLWPSLGVSRRGNLLGRAGTQRRMIVRDFIYFFPRAKLCATCTGGKRD